MSQQPGLSILTAAKSWDVDLLVPETTVWLPIADDRPVDPLCLDYADALLGPEASRKQRAALAGIIRDGTLSARLRCPLMSGLIFPAGPAAAQIPVAEIDLSRFTPGPAGAARTLDYYRRLYGAPSEDTIGDIEVSEAGLPAGPALRFHRQWIQAPARRGRSSHRLHGPPREWRTQRERGIQHERGIQREHVVYAICPPQIPDSLVLTITWVDLTRSQALIQAADATARSLSLS